MIDLMRAAGLDPRVDPAGNIFGRRAGTDASLPPILFGSHIDSVPNGGNFDGDLGSLAALGALEALAAANLRTRHPLEMVVWSAEEGVAFNRGLNGSRIVAGDVKPSDMDQVWNGMTRADAIRKIGGIPVGSWRPFDRAVRTIATSSSILNRAARSNARAFPSVWSRASSRSIATR